MLTFVRHRMELGLEKFSVQIPMPEGFQIDPVTTAGVDDLARLSLDCYIDTPDWDLDPALQTFEGCRDFISELLSGQEIFGGRQGKFLGDLSFVLRHGKELAGAAYTLFSEDTAFIIDFAVAPPVRGRGIGRAFMSYALQRYREAGYQKALLLVTATNEPAVRLYKSLGFQVEDTHTVEV